MGNSGSHSCCDRPLKEDASTQGNSQDGAFLPLPWLLIGREGCPSFSPAPLQQSEVKGGAMWRAALLASQWWGVEPPLGPFSQSLLWGVWRLTKEKGGFLWYFIGELWGFYHGKLPSLFITMPILSPLLFQSPPFYFFLMSSVSCPFHNTFLTSLL